MQNGVRTDKHAEFRRTEKFGEGMAFRVLLERMHPPTLSSLIMNLETLARRKAVYWKFCQAFLNSPNFAEARERMRSP
jgi:hypothetical protein